MSKNNPIAFMDMNGKDGVAVIDYENHSIIINQKFYYIVNDDLLRRKVLYVLLVEIRHLIRLTSISREIKYCLLETRELERYTQSICNFK